MGVALIIPNRNNARYLTQCVESALGQTLPYEEIIVVDDASDDASAEVIRALAAHAPTVRMIRFGSRMGVSAARDAGIRSATSTHISTLDSDDFLWSPSKNENEWAVIESARGGERGVVAFSDIRRVSHEGEDRGSVAARRAVREGDVYRWLLLLRGFVPRDFTMERSAYFSTGGYDNAFSLYEDWDLKLRLARTCDFRYTHADGVAYRLNPGGLSRASLPKHLAAMRRVIWKNTNHLTEPARSLVRCHATWRICCFHRGSFKEFLLGRQRRSLR